MLFILAVLSSLILVACGDTQVLPDRNSQQQSADRADRQLDKEVEKLNK
jgi:outer membrane biogenesis lipoprotein LolB